MARNRIQFQKGLSEARFQALYGDEERCRALVIGWRWPDGFICPKCRGRACCVVGSRRLFQCNSCHHQASPTAGTIFDSTKLPLTVWFRAMYLITQTKQGISSIRARPPPRNDADHSLEDQDQACRGHAPRQRPHPARWARRDG